MSARLSGEPLLCLVTDRRREPAAPPDRLVDLAAAAAAAGVQIVQIREPDLDAAALFVLTRRVLQAVAGTSAAVVVNDRLDVALAAGAAGVHLRGDSMPARRVRAMVPDGFLVGQSVHGASDALAAAPHADYLIMGTVYPTRSKDAAWPLSGIEGLRQVCRSVAVPVLAIGGVRPAQAGEIAAAGAAGLAGIGLFADAAGSGDPRPALRHLVPVITREFRRGLPRPSHHGCRLPIATD